MPLGRARRQSRARSPRGWCPSSPSAQAVRHRRTARGRIARRRRSAVSPIGQRLVPVRALAAHGGRPSRNSIGRVVRRDHADARAGLDRHVADRQPAFHRHRRGWRSPHIRPHSRSRRRRRCVWMIARITSFAVTASGSVPSIEIRIVASASSATRSASRGRGEAGCRRRSARPARRRRHWSPCGSRCR